jgi:hypothetical protein
MRTKVRMLFKIFSYESFRYFLFLIMFFLLWIHFVQVVFGILISQASEVHELFVSLSVFRMMISVESCELEWTGSFAHEGLRRFTRFFNGFREGNFVANLCLNSD